MVTHDIKALKKEFVNYLNLQSIIAPGIAKEKVKAAVADNFMPSDIVDAAINVLLS